MPTLRHRLRAWLKEAGATKRELFEIQLAATEAFANAVEHPEERSSHLVEIAGTFTNRTVVLSIRDYGRWQNDNQPSKTAGSALRSLTP
jgi:anti-sigma regulatory factor (Ser/Thr protein kinase)